MKEDTYIQLGIQGGPGSFNEQAAVSYCLKHNLKDYKIVYLYTTEKVLEKLTQGKIDLGIFAINNSIGGVVTESEKVMHNYTFSKFDEIKLNINHYLMKRKDILTSHLTTIMAHPQVFLQCKETLRKKYPFLKQQTGKGDLIDTATAAKAVFEDKLPKTIAILGPKTIAQKYNFDIIDENLQDRQDNITTFLVVKK